jgi:hypothetical protein
MVGMLTLSEGEMEEDLHFAQRSLSMKDETTE